MQHSALRRAIERGNLQDVLTALEHGADIEEPDMHGDPGLPLRTACFKGHIAIVEELIKRGANIHAPNAQGAGGPIRMAARAHHRHIVDLLMRNGAKLPADVKLPPDDSHERRKSGDPRKLHVETPPGLDERRSAKERRATSAQAPAPTERQPETHVTRPQSLPVTPATHDDDDVAAMVFERARH